MKPPFSAVSQLKKKKSIFMLIYTNAILVETTESTKKVWILSTYHFKSTLSYIAFNLFFFNIVKYKNHRCFTQKFKLLG